MTRDTESMIGDVIVGIGAFAVKQRLAPGKTVFNPMPVTHRRLADLPAKKNHLGAEHARKVDQSLLHALADTAKRVDFVDPAGDLSDQFGDLAVLTQPVHEIG